LYDYTIIGGGIVGLATGAALMAKRPSSRILLLEKEPYWAFHQTGHNSGVIHSGIYYKPGSLKAKLAVCGSQSMTQFCRKHGIEHDVCGKVIIATQKSELPQLEKLFERGLQNGLCVTRLLPEEVREIEPNVQCVAGIRVPVTGIVDYKQVCRTLVTTMQDRGIDLRLGTKVTGIITRSGHKVIETEKGSFETNFLINCGGLYSDRLARLDGTDPKARIVPFRGEYYELRPESRYLVKNLIYPVPNPAFPFLGVHFTRMIDGSIHAGPNAVLSLKREGYCKSDFDLRDFGEVVGFGGFWKLACRYWREGSAEMMRSLSKAIFTKSLQRMVPALRSEDLIPSGAGVRAQALRPDGGLVDDFLLVNGEGSIHVCNAPSPAATASLEIGRIIAQQAA
jgi:L-2-hydroxyglutarate oxidase